MAIINVLDSSVYNRISAGEVVEKPAAVVKELVENSIDAGAKNIRIAVYGGGLKKISVFDDGCGIAESEIKKAFLPHATSKIKNIIDLDFISSLGFRGEALASIASVSYVQMVSKTADAELGCMLEIDGGKFGNITKIATNNGTVVNVNRLFFNTPARLKFLRKPKYEENEITNIVQRFILSNTNVNFEYIVDDRIVYKTSSNLLKDRIIMIYGDECANSLIEVEKSDDILRLNGYIANGNYTKPNSNWQTLIVNGRYVQSSMISKTVFLAYKEHIMKGEYPFYVLNLFIDFEKVDVNVHPTKMEIRFDDVEYVQNFILMAIADALESNFKLKSISTSPSNSYAPCEEENQEINPDFMVKAGISFDSNEHKHELFDAKTSYLSEIVLGDEPEKPFLQKDTPTVVEKQTIQEKMSFDTAYNLIGSLFNSYLLVESEGRLLLIDQHAAHERINYNKLTQNYKNQNFSQCLAEPYFYQTSMSYIALLDDHLNQLRDLGFDIDVAGEDYIRVNAVPPIIAKAGLKKFLDYIFADINMLKGKTDEFLRNHIASIACKASVRAGEKLADIEIKSLIEDLGKQDTLPICPHGRPVIVSITEEEIEKWFKRIV